MEVFTRTKNLNQQLELIEIQINKTISDIGRLSSYRQDSTNMLVSIRNEKLGFLHLLKEKKQTLINKMQIAI